MPLFLQPFVKYATFTGRARRAEYWWFYLAQLIVYVLIVALAFTGESVEGGLSVLLVGGGLFALVSFLPNLALTVRRLHDTNRSALWLLLYAPGIISAMLAGSQAIATHSLPTTQPIFSVLGFIANTALLILLSQKGTDGPNRFGPDPKGNGDISHLFDAVEAEPIMDQAESAPHTSVFDFTPDTKVAAMRAPSDTFQASPARQRLPITPSNRPVFGRRGRLA